ncbi:heterokaryon incompatibility protein-domain-containing protein [Rhexocercosporidium sp. MPI-PUGE-AT-0058]|nr:heterokaryon incompatibility protein-domain-containing protein [Rhexocercosporidium sp. MPI-PUGE-AT-0058]
MQQFIACSRDAFFFGEPDEIVLRNYDYLLPEDCLPLNQVRLLVSDPTYGYRYKLLWDGISSFVEDHLIKDLELPGYWGKWDRDYYVALVVIANGLLFVEVRQSRNAKGGGLELVEPAGSLHIQFYLPATASGFGIVDQSPFIWPAVGRASDIPEDLTTSDLSLAAQWLNDCMAGSGKHHNCRIDKEPPFLPTRVIDVGSSDGEARLYISHPGEKAHYIALSHCWGGMVPIMNTVATMHELVERLPLEIPKTFADGIAVTRTMGQRYLWIDSLCILQDSASDWIDESTKMDQVYSQALFTIVADAAENSSSGFLAPPARSVRKHKTLLCNLPTSPDGTSPYAEIHIRDRGDLAFQLPYHDHYADNGSETVSLYFSHHSEIPPPIRSKLSTRAWAFQERLLSPRTLHFGPSEMAWECRALCACECSATNERTSRITSLLKGSIAIQPSLATTTESKSPQSVLRSMNNSWQREIVEEYTRLDLTRAADRLSALAGIATKALSLRPDDQYIFGMWRNTIRECLSWYTTPDHPSHRLRPVFESESPAPSWSWMSVSGQIKHARIASVPSDASFIDVLDVHNAPDQLASQSRGCGWCILAEGYLVPIQSVWFQPCKEVMVEDCTWESWSTACYRVKWPLNVRLPENCVVIPDVHHAVAVSDTSIKLDRLDGLEDLADMELVMLLTALSKGVVFGLVLKRRGVGAVVGSGMDLLKVDASDLEDARDDFDKVLGHAGGDPDGNLDEYERVGFVNGMDSLGSVIVCWSSTPQSIEPLFDVDWEPDEGVEGILEGAGIRRSKGHSLEKRAHKDSKFPEYGAMCYSRVGLGHCVVVFKMGRDSERAKITTSCFQWVDDGLDVHEDVKRSVKIAPWCGPALVTLKPMPSKVTQESHLKFSYGGTLTNNEVILFPIITALDKDPSNLHKSALTERSGIFNIWSNIKILARSTKYEELVTATHQEASLAPEPVVKEVYELPEIVVLKSKDLKDAVARR